MLRKIMLLFVGLTLASTVTLAGDNILPYQLKSGKPYAGTTLNICLLYTSPSPRDATLSRMPSSA